MTLAPDWHCHPLDMKWGYRKNGTLSTQTENARPMELGAKALPHLTLELVTVRIVVPCERMRIMKRPFAATVWREGKWYVSQCLEVDVASQGETEDEALANLKEALELHFEPPRPNRLPDVRMIEVEIGAA